MGMSIGNGKINNDALSAAAINCSVGFKSVLRRETEGISECKSKPAPLFKRRKKKDNLIKRLREIIHSDESNFM